MNGAAPPPQRPLTRDPGKTDAGEVVLHAASLTKHFPITRGVVFKRRVGLVRAVDGVDLQLRRGQTLGIVGESGCGKSTLARILAGLARPTSGDVTVLGHNIAHARGRNLKGMRRNIQLVFQDPYTALDPRMSAARIIGEPFAIHPEVAPRRDRGGLVQQLMEAVGLNPDHADRYPHQFSGGQRQRIGIARALALRPKIIVCDEPVSALDVSVQAQVINLLADLQREFGLSYVFIAHDLSLVQHIADRVAVMYLGKLVETGTETEVYAHPTHPYTQALLSAAPPPLDSTRSAHRDRIVLAGEVPSPADPPSGCRFRTRCWKAVDVCTSREPLLQPRPGSPHPAACHFATERETSDTRTDNASDPAR